MGETSGQPTAALAAGALVLATPVATWWLVGDLSEPVANPDYMIRPISVSQGMERAVGLGSMLVLAVSISVVASFFRRRQLDRKWVPPIVFLVVSAAIAGAGWRVVTAGVIGANIGGGIVVLGGLPLVIGLVIAALVTSFLGPVRHR
jgi:hypothetical protein